jgi:hypothetical protein
MRSMFRSWFRAYVAVFVAVLLVTASILVAIMVVRQHTCLMEMQADPLGGLPASRIPAQCASQFHQHVEGGLILAETFSMFVASAFAILRLSPRRGKDLRSA